jgi:hypothetical protein
MSKIRSRRRRRLAVILAAAAALAFAAYAFTASNTVPATKAGDGYGAISGYTVTNVAYQLETDPQYIDSVSFTLGSTAGTVKAKVVNASTTYANCANTGGNNWSCDFPTGGQTVLSADELRVIATS